MCPVTAEAAPVVPRAFPPVLGFRIPSQTMPLPAMHGLRDYLVHIQQRVAVRPAYRWSREDYRPADSLRWSLLSAAHLLLRVLLQTFGSQSLGQEGMNRGIARL